MVMSKKTLMVTLGPFFTFFLVSTPGAAKAAATMARSSTAAKTVLCKWENDSKST